MHRLIAIIFFLVCVMHCGAVQIVEFCPDPYLHDDMDEYLVLSGSGTLDGIIVSDGEGGFRFPAGSLINGNITIARSAPAFEKSHFKLPDFEWMDNSPLVPNVIGGDPLRMANIKDELMLYENGRLVQEVSWPGDVKCREGQIHYLENGMWDPRPLLIGQSRFSSSTFHNVTVITFVSPDCSYEIVSHIVDKAHNEILVNMYEFSSPTLADLLVGAKNRDVDVEILVEGGPVGGISPEEKAVIWKMNQSGIPVFQMTAPTGGHAPYRYDHAKYIVIDRNFVLLTSENFKSSGIPPDGISGNRGWGVSLEDPALSEYYATVFRTDVSGQTIVPILGSSGTYEYSSNEKYIDEFSPGSFEGATVIPVIAPDTSSQITDLLNSAERSIEIEQAYITNETRFTLNPYLSTAINASRRGVHVRVLLDSYYYNIEDEKDNDEMVALINHIATAEHLPLEARCVDLQAHTFEKIHNKGVIVDDRRVRVSSINWNSNSPNFNREAGAIIDHTGVARYFLNVFNDDWDPAVHSPQKTTDYLKIAAVIGVIALLLTLYYRRHIR